MNGKVGGLFPWKIPHSCGEFSLQSGFFVEWMDDVVSHPITNQRV